MNKKRVLALVLASALIMSMSGCGNGQDEQNIQSEQETVEMIQQAGELADYSANVTLGQYTGLNIEVAKVEVSEQELQDVMNRMVEIYNNVYAETETITDRAVVSGDNICMDFTTTVDGEAMSELAGTDVSYQVGSGQIEKSLDEQMVGLKPGESKDVICTFAADTDFTELAGKEVTFHVTVDYIYGETKTLEWGNELVSAMTEGQYSDAEQYKEVMREEMQAKAEAEQRDEYTSKLWDAILADCTIELPADVVETNAENYYATQKEIYEYYATYYSYTYDEYMEKVQEMTDKEFHEKSYEYAETELERIYAAVSIFKATGMEFTDQEYSEGVAALVETYGYESSAAFVEAYGEAYIREVLVTDKVEKYLLDENNMVVKE